jgi:hypothetical protein
MTKSKLLKLSIAGNKLGSVGFKKIEETFMFSKSKLEYFNASDCELEY